MDEPFEPERLAHNAGTAEANARHDDSLPSGIFIPLLE
jgi:hypothetical protein